MRKFHLYPAIDIKDGKCVRLLYGDIDKQTIYENNPLNQVEHFIKNGCKWIHIVDLNAAMNLGNNEKIISNILKEFGKNIKIQLGGGIRSIHKIKSWIEKDVSRVVIGTLAYDNPDIINSLGAKYKGMIALAIDVRNNLVAINGWKKQLNISPIELVNKLDPSLINSIIYTDIDKDGTLEGINVYNIIQFCKSFPFPVIASGGVATNKDITDLYNLRKYDLIGVIIGKAIYEKKVSVNEIINIIYK